MPGVFMKNILYISIFCFFFSQSVLCREYPLRSCRDPDDGSPINCCVDHIDLGTNKNEIEKYLTLIPELSRKCSHRVCNTCGYDVRSESFEDSQSRSTSFYSYIVIEDWCLCVAKQAEQYGIDYSCMTEEWAKKLRSRPPITECKKGAIYPGYYQYSKYLSFFVDFCEYIKTNNSCACYWPELSSKAALVSNKGYKGLKELLQMALFPFEDFERINWSDDSPEWTEEQQNFFAASKYLNFHGMTITCICHSLLFSHYYYVCKDIYEYSLRHNQAKTHKIVCEEINCFLQSMAQDFDAIYTTCLEQHPTQKIANEKDFLRSFQDRDPTQPEQDVPGLIAKSYKKSSRNKKKIAKTVKSGLLASDMYLEKGASYNDRMLYTAAIEELNSAIKLNPSNRDAYIERAFAYFELGQFEKALQDYAVIEKLEHSSPPLIAKFFIFCPEAIEVERSAGIADFKASCEYFLGLREGAQKAAINSALDFFPALIRSATGIGEGLWSLARHPVDTYQEFRISVLSAFEYLRGQSIDTSLLKAAAPEMLEFSKKWNELSPREKGHCDGYVFTKYGAALFTLKGTAAGVRYAQKVRRTTTMQTLKTCALSQENKAVIVSEAAERLALRATFKNSNRIFVKTSNVQYHVMQKKHAWDRVVKITGNAEEDFIKVVAYLEEHQVVSPKNIKTTNTYLTKNKSMTVEGIVYDAKIGNERIRVIVEKYESGESYLKDAWVVTKS